MSYMRKIYIAVIFIVIIIVIYFFNNDVENKVCFGDKCVEVQIADDNEERSRGLMFVSSMEENKGMLFVFDKSERHSFWMKNTLIPLDIIWISEDFEVVHIENAVPCEEEPCEIYSDNGEARYALEVNSGWAERNGIEVGSEVEIKGFEL